MNDPQDAFREEAYELLSELETALMELEDSPKDSDLIDRVFRAMHTIKGSGAMFGFTKIADFTHELETVFDLVREGRIAVTGRLVGRRACAGGITVRCDPPLQAHRVLVARVGRPTGQQEKTYQRGKKFLLENKKRTN